MLQIPCVHCGPRNAQEFVQAGEIVPPPSLGSATPQQWREFLYVRDNPAGWVRERWYHGMGCGRFMEVERHTVTNVVRTAQDVAASREPPAEGPEAMS